MVQQQAPEEPEPPAYERIVNKFGMDMHLIRGFYDYQIKMVYYFQDFNIIKYLFI